MLSPKQYIYTFVLAVSLLMASCSSAANSSNEAKAAEPPPPPSKQLPSEFGEQAELLDRHCTSEEGDLHTRVQSYASKVEAKTGKKLAIKDVYTRMASLAPHLGTNKQNCDRLMFQALLEMAPDVRSQQEIEELP